MPHYHHIKMEKNKKIQYTLFNSCITSSNYNSISILNVLNNCTIFFCYKVFLNIQDIVILINYILDIDQYDDEDFQNADINFDGTLNVLDVIIIVDLITY